MNVGLVQINNSFSGQNYFPLAIGMLQAYAQKTLGDVHRFKFRVPLYKRIRVDDAVLQLLGCNVVLFSVYVWNMNISAEIARRLKAEQPDVVVVFGGPHVPDSDDTFLTRYPFIDVACHGEGERTAASVLEHLEQRDWPSVPSVSFIDQTGALRRTPRGARSTDLSAYPSPYLEGVFAPLMDANPRENWIALWETNRGCPFACTFCDWGSAVASKVYAFEIDRLYREVEWFAEHRIEYIFCCDANFGILPRDVDIAAFVADVKQKRGYPSALSVQATKNATERAYATQKILADSGLNKGVDIALQSLDTTTLKIIKRSNISTDTYQELQRRFTKDNVETYTDLILGLPGETYDSFTSATAAIIDNGQHNRIQFNNLSILPNAEMADPAYRRAHGLETVVSKVVNIHGSVDAEGEILEDQELVIATAAMPREDWVRTRAFAWSAALLYFDKILQMPLMVARQLSGCSHRELIELFSEGDLAEYPTLREINRFFRQTARAIQEGGPEYVASAEWLNIWWPADEYVFIKLVVDDSMSAFYDESERLLQQFIEAKTGEPCRDVLTEAILLNRSLLKRPFQADNLTLQLSFNLWPFYQGVRQGQPVSIEPGGGAFEIDRSRQTWNSLADWCREVVWWGNKKGAYLYSGPSGTIQLAGHF